MSRVREAYDRNAARYHRRFSRYEPYQNTILDFVGRVPSPGTLLDLGCGSGANACLAVDAGLAVRGVDLSSSMLSIARRECPGGVFELGDLRALEIDQAFDAVLASFCIVHLADGEAVRFLEQLPGLMKPGALLHVSFMEGREPAWTTTSFSDQPLFYNYFDRAWVAAILEGGGLVPTSVTTHDYPEKNGSTTTDVFLELRRPR